MFFSSFHIFKSSYQNMLSSAEKIILVIVTNRYHLQREVLVFLHTSSHGRHTTTLGGRDYPNFTDKEAELEEEVSVRRKECGTMKSYPFPSPVVTLNFSHNTFLIFSSLFLLHVYFLSSTRILSKAFSLHNSELDTEGENWCQILCWTLSDSLSLIFSVALCGRHYCHCF